MQLSTLISRVKVFKESLSSQLSSTTINKYTPKEIEDRYFRDFDTLFYKDSDQHLDKIFAEISVKSNKYVELTEILPQYISHIDKIISILELCEQEPKIYAKVKSILECEDINEVSNEFLTNLLLHPGIFTELTQKFQNLKTNFNYNLLFYYLLGGLSLCIASAATAVIMANIVTPFAPIIIHILSCAITIIAVSLYKIYDLTRMSNKLKTIDLTLSKFIPDEYSHDTQLHSKLQEILNNAWSDVNQKISEESIENMDQHLDSQIQHLWKDSYPSIKRESMGKINTRSDSIIYHL